MNPNMSMETFSFAAPEGAPAFPVAQPKPQPPPPHVEDSLEYWRARARVLDPVVFELQNQIKSFREQIRISEAANAAFIVEWKVKYDEVKANYDQLFEEDKQRAQAHAAAASEWEATIQKLTEEKLALEEKAEKWENTSERLAEEKLALEGKSDEWNESKQMLTGEKLALEQKVADMAAFSKEEDSKRIKLQMQIDELVEQNDQQAATIDELGADVEEKRGQVAKLSAEVLKKERDIKDRESESTKAKKHGETALGELKAANSLLNKKIKELREAQDTAHTELQQLRSDMDLSHEEKKKLEAKKKTYEQALKDRDSRLLEQRNIERAYSEAMGELASTKEHVKSLETELGKLNRENERLRQHQMDTHDETQISLDRELLSADSAEGGLGEAGSDSGSDHTIASTRSVSEERVESSVEDSTLSSDTDRTLSPSRLDSGVESTLRTSRTGFYSVRNRLSRASRMYDPDRNTRARIHAPPSDSDPGESSRLASRGAPADGEAAVSPASVGTPETEPDSRNAAVASTATALPSTLLASDELPDIKNQKPTTEDRLTIEPSSKDSPLIDTSSRVTTQSHVKQAKEEEDVTASEKSRSFRSNEDPKVKDAGDITEEKPTGHTTSEFTVEHSPTPQELGRAHIAGAAGIAAPSIAITKSKTFSHNPFRCWLQVYIDLWTCFMGWLAFHNSSLIADTGLNGPRTKYLQTNPAAPYHPEHTDLKPPSSKAASGENARAYRDQAPPNIELPPFWTNVFWLLTHIAFYAFCYICASNYSCTLRERASWQAANELTRQMFLRDYGYLHRHFGEQNWLDIICFNLSTWLDVGPSYSG